MEDRSRACRRSSAPRPTDVGATASLRAEAAPAAPIAEAPARLDVEGRDRFVRAQRALRDGGVARAYEAAKPLFATYPDEGSPSRTCDASSRSCAGSRAISRPPSAPRGRASRAPRTAAPGIDDVALAARQKLTAADTRKNAPDVEMFPRSTALVRRGSLLGRSGESASRSATTHP